MYFIVFYANNLPMSMADATGLVSPVQIKAVFI